MAKVITTNLNLLEEVQTIRGLEAQIKELSELKEERIKAVKEVMEQATFHISYTLI